MIETVKQILKYIKENGKKPTLNDIIANDELLNNKMSLFVTFYLWWEIVWSAWNVVELKENWALELIENTYEAINDIRFSDKNIISKIDQLKYRIDKIISRKTITNDELKNLNPIKKWILVIKKDYEKLAIILPNISSTMTNYTDIVNVLSKKLNSTFKPDDYIIYEIETEKIIN